MTVREELERAEHDRLTDMTSGMVEGMELGQEYRAFPV